jgi:hypothetical protein
MAILAVIAAACWRRVEPARRRSDRGSPGFDPAGRVLPQGEYSLRAASLQQQVWCEGSGSLWQPRLPSQAGAAAIPGSQPLAPMAHARLRRPGTRRSGRRAVFPATGLHTCWRSRSNAENPAT